MPMEHVGGINKGHIILYALSTCIWCRKTKRLLTELGVDYYFVDVDLLEAAEKDSTYQELRRWNPAGSFPTLIIDHKKCVAGFDEEKIRKELS